MATVSSVPDVGALARKHIAQRLLPFLFVLYISNYVDRVNVAYAGLEMTRELGFTDAVFGFGSGVFFVGYLLFQVPGALIVERWSAKRLMAPVLIGWGLVTVATGFIHTAPQFYAARILLGIVEAGFFPGMIVYLSHWFRSEDRATAIALFMAAIPTSCILASPLAGLLLDVHWLGVPGWRWLFILEGIPPVLLGIATLWYLTDWPHQARWLPKPYSDWITAQLQREKLTTRTGARVSILKALQKPEILLLTLFCTLAYATGYAIMFWMPTILKRASGLPNATVGLLTAIPYTAGLLAMVWNGRHSDRTGERRWHSAVPLFVGAAGLFLLVGTAQHFWTTYLIFIFLVGSLSAYLPTIWALPSELLSDTACAAAVGFINCIGNLGGLAGPYAVGYLRTRTGSFAAGYICLALGWLIAGSVVLCLRLRGQAAAADHFGEADSAAAA